jgi:hypothetical protein
VHDERFGDLISDGHHRVEGRLRVLEDHGDLTSTHPAHVLVGQLPQISPVEQDLPGDDPSRGVHHTHDRPSGHRLPRARFADHAEHLAAAQRQVDVVHRPDRSGIGHELGAQPTNLK